MRLMQAALSKPLEHGFPFEGSAQHNAELVSLLTELLSARVDWLLDMDKSGAKQAATDKTAEAVYKSQAKKLTRLIGKLEGDA